MKTIICPRCSGHGVITKYNHVEGGRCFQCEGLGKIEVEDHVIDIVKEIREAREIEDKFEKEYKELWNQYQDEIRGRRDWWNYIESEGTQETTKSEERYIRINQYIDSKKEWKEFIKNHMELADDIDEYMRIKNEFDNKHMNRD